MGKEMKDSRIGSLAWTEFEIVLGLPAPALFKLVTLNSYSTPSTRPSTVNLLSGSNNKEVIKQFHPTVMFLQVTRERRCAPF